MEAALTKPAIRRRTTRRKTVRKTLTPQQRQARHDAEHRRMRQMQCNLFQFWRVCAKRACARARSCAGDPEACMQYWWPQLPEDMKNDYREMVIEAAAAHGISRSFGVRQA